MSNANPGAPGFFRSGDKQFRKWDGMGASLSTAPNHSGLDSITVSWLQKHTYT